MGCSVDARNYSEVYGDNIWPQSKDIPEFEEAFKQLGWYVLSLRHLCTIRL
jgi:hypothetical protein